MGPDPSRTQEPIDMQDRRKQDRGSPDRRTDRRQDTPWWGFLLAFIVAGMVLSGVFSLVY